MFKAVIKRAQAMFAPVKTTRKRKVTLPVIVKAANTPKREDEILHMLEVLQMAIQRSVHDFLEALENHVDYPDEAEYCDAIRLLAIKLGFPEVESFNDDGIDALCAAMDYEKLNCYRFEDDAKPDLDNAMRTISIAVKQIDSGNYTLVKSVFSDEGLGNYLCDQEFGISLNRYYSSMVSTILEYVDMEALGRDFRYNNDGEHTHLGYFQYGVLNF